MAKLGLTPEKQKWWKINRTLLPVKMFYFFFLAGKFDIGLPVCFSCEFCSANWKEAGAFQYLYNKCEHATQHKWCGLNLCCTLPIGNYATVWGCLLMQLVSTCPFQLELIEVFRVFILSVQCSLLFQNLFNLSFLLQPLGICMALWKSNWKSGVMW